MLNGDTLIVNIVLCARRQPVPLKVIVSIRASQRISALRLSIQWDNLVFGSWNKGLVVTAK